jgi:lysophospholipase L1-like esterase
VEILNPAVNGYTTEDLIREELPLAPSFAPSMVTVLIGVNDWVQRFGGTRYAANLDRIYDALAGLGVAPGGVVAVSIPDFSDTPAGLGFGAPEAIRAGLREFNALAAAAAAARGFTWVDIFDLSRSRAGTPGWIGADGLHPSDPQYDAWAQFIWTAVGPRWSEL